MGPKGAKDHQTGMQWLALHRICSSKVLNLKKPTILCCGVVSGLERSKVEKTVRAKVFTQPSLQGSSGL